MATRSVTGRVLWGIILIALGTLFLLDRIEVADTGEVIGTWWPLIPIGIGGWGVLTSSGRNLGALILLFVGIALQVDQLELFEPSVWELAWPVGLILLGLWLLFRRPWSGSSRVVETTSTEAGDHVDVVAMLSGQNRRITSQAWRGGEVTAIMGGAEVFLDEAVPVEGGARLQLTAIMGGIELYIPAEWEIDLHGTPFLGSVEDKRRRIAPTDGDRPRLRIDATAIMGGIELKDA